VSGSSNASGGAQGAGNSAAPQSGAAQAPAQQPSQSNQQVPSSSASGSSSLTPIGNSSTGSAPAATATSFTLSSFGGMGMTVSYYQQRGSISVLGATPQQIEMIRDFIKNNDKKEPQAYLEVSIIELSDTGTRQFDNNWTIMSEGFSASFNSESLTTNPLYPTFFRGDGYKLVDAADPTKVLYSVGKFTGSPVVSYDINYIVKNSKGRVLANPRIIITNGQASTVDLTSDYVKSVVSQVITSTSTGTTSSGTIQRTYTIGSDEGIKVNIMPFISPDGYVTMNVKPEYATIKEPVYGLGADGKTKDLVATLLQRRNLDLKNVRIKDGETLVIGGMIRESETKDVKKFPVLGELPGVGFFFRSTSTVKSKQELVIMLTPKIIKDTDDVVNNSNTAL
jgi:type II secretory pathway component GspD/PulD (secretin)